MKLWPTQQRGLEQIESAVNAGERRICVAGPTGSGKTTIMCERMKSTAWRSILYTHRRMLFTQTHDRLRSSGIECGALAAGCEANIDRRVQIAMIQSEASRVKKLKSHFDAQEVLVDEAHQNKAGQAELLLNLHSGDGAPVIGFTATPLGIGHIYDRLIIAGTNSELRQIGALVPAIHYCPDEPDTKLIGKVKVDGGECGIAKSKRQAYVSRIFGRVVDQYDLLNPDRKPTLLFAPGVEESIWFAEKLTELGIPTAHIDGTNIWWNGELMPNTDALRGEIGEALEAGHVKVVSNRFVLREGIDFPFVEHLIFATIFGSLSAYLQAGGRGLRASPSTGKEHVVIQDHGGNFWRHGSLNADREWDLSLDDRIVAATRIREIREQKEAEPIHCVQCNGMRLRGPLCPHCGYQYQMRGRPVLQANGTLQRQTIKEFKARRYAEPTDKVRKDWCGRIHGVRKSTKDSVKSMTFNQVASNFARDNNWNYPPECLPMMPKHDCDWARAVKSIPTERLT